MSQQLGALQICVSVMHLQARTRTRHTVLLPLSLILFCALVGAKGEQIRLSEVLQKLVHYQVLESPVHFRTVYHFHLTFVFFLYFNKIGFYKGKYCADMYIA